MNEISRYSKDLIVSLKTACETTSFLCLLRFFSFVESFRNPFLKPYLLLLLVAINRHCLRFHQIFFVLESRLLVWDF